MYVTRARLLQSFGWLLAALLLAGALGLYPSPALASTPLDAVIQSSPPDAPSSITLERTGTGFRGKGTLTASWPAVTGATKYQINYTADKGRTWKVLASEHTSTSITFEIWNGYTYIVGVRAGNANDWSGWTDSPESPPIPNSLPSTLLPGPDWVSVTRGNGTLTATWAPVTGAIKYLIRYSTDGWRNAILLSDDEKSTSITMNNANNGATYIIGVRAGKSDNYYSFGPISYSAPSGPYVTTPNYSPPPSPTLTASSVTHNGATLTIANRSGEWWYKANTGPHSTCSNIAVSGSSVNLNGLTPSTQYTYTAYSNWVCSTSIATASAFTTAAPPVTLTVSAIGRTTATLTIGNHTAQWWYKADVGPDATCQGPVAAGTSAESLTGLTEETPYVYKAYSATGCGASNLVATASSFTTLPPPHVTNLKTTSSGDSDVNSSRQQGVDFTTGPNPSGYTLTSVILPMRYKTTGTGTLAITLHEQSGSSPSSTTLATLTGTAPTSSTFTNTVWTCSGSSCELDRSTKYFIVATLTGTGEYALQYSAFDDVESTTPSDSGWDIGLSHFKIADSVWSSWNDLHLVRVNFEFNPSLTASNVTSSSAALTLNHHTGTWYSKRIHPDTTVCSVGVTGTTQNRTALTSNVTYGYTAYSDSTCTAANALDTAYFSTTDAAVGNLRETQASTNWTIGGGSIEEYATAFTTGSHGAGYTLTGVTLDFAAKTSSPGDISVALHGADTSNSSNPAATAAATLSGSDPDAAGLQTYTCSGSGCDLSASTTYFIVTSVPTGPLGGSYNQRNTASDSESVQSPATGWTIANAGRHKAHLVPWTATNSASMHIAANEKPPTLTASSITSATATLTIAHHTGNWHHKETHPSTSATCSASANTGTTASLSSLTADKLYAYTAYSDSGCTAANALATAYFSTTDDGVGNLNEESDFNISVGLGGSGNQSVTAAFRTGSGASDLESVTLRFGDKSATGTTGNIQVTLHEPSGANPSSTAKATLSGSNPDTAGLYSYTCSSGCYLNADSTYFVVVAAPNASGAGAYSLNLTQFDDEINHPAANGWSIGNTGRHKSQRFAWTNHGVGRVANMHVAANDSATLTASSVGATTATLTIGGHTGAWWYDADTGPDTTCRSVAANTSSKALTGLTAGTNYVYSAYDATGCGDADLIAVADVFTTSVSVSNLDKDTTTTDLTLGTYAQGFTTGNASGYTLVSATVDIDTSHSSISVSLRAAKSDGKPAATNRATLTGTPAIGEVEFTCDATNSGNDCSLAKSTKYFIVVTGSSAYLDSTASDAETLVPSGNGWSIENAAREGSGFDLDSTGYALRIKVEAAPHPTLSASSITDTSANLGIKYHTGDWWFMADKGFFSVNCESVSGTSVGLNNRLAKQTTYVFTAYSDSACTTANALDSVTFKTTGTVITVTGVSGTVATLNIAGHTAAWWYDADSGPDTTCQSVAAGTSSENLTGLTDGNTYTYTAYSKTGCNAVDELDSVTFSMSDVSVGNLDEQADNASCQIGFNVYSRKCATAFTTGTHSAGYTLKSVTGLFHAKTASPGNIVVAIHAADTTNSSHPAASASITLTGSNPDTAGVHTYTCSTNCDLTANTTYFVVMSTADNSQRKLYAWRRTTSDDETVTPSTATGWAIANDGLNHTGTTWANLPRNHTGVMHVAADNKTS